MINNKAIFEAIPDTLLQVDRAGVILGFKPSEQQLPLVPSGEVLGRHISAILPPDMATAATDAIAEALDSGEIQFFESYAMLGNGTTYIEVRAVRAGMDEVLLIVRDVSEWRRYEACDLLILDIATRVQQEQSLEDIFSLACGQIKKIFGMGLLWIAHKEADDSVKLYAAGEETVRFLPEDMRDLTAGNGFLGAALRTGKFQLMGIEDPRMLSWRELLQNYHVTTGAAFPLKVGRLVLGALIMFSSDCDVWKRRTIVQLTSFAEQIALAIHATITRQRLKLLTAGLESAANAIVIASRKGEIQWVNPAFLELNGYGIAEVLNGNVRILDSGLHQQSFFKLMRRHISAGRIWHGEIVNRRKDGSRYIADTTITPVRDEVGKISNYIAIIQDITKRKQTEYEMLEAREALSQAERLSALGIMAAGIAHEINQPLNSLKVIADGMLYWYQKGRVLDISEAMENIREISKDADRIDNIIKHMRSFIYKNEFTEPVPCDINLAVEESLLLLGAQLLSHNIQVKTELAVELPPIMGNSTQLEQIIINLLINAMHALDAVNKSGKEINVTTGWKKGKAFLAVSDNGPGINKAIIGKIFDPFFTTKSAGGGMGLGLSVVHSIVSSYGGQISVKNNKLTGGAVFWIEFPVEISKQKGEGSA